MDARLRGHDAKGNGREKNTHHCFLMPRPHIMSHGEAEAIRR